MTNYLTYIPGRVLLRNAYEALAVRAAINRSLRRIDRGYGQDGAGSRAQWRITENRDLRGLEWRAHRALWGHYDL